MATNLSGEYATRTCCVIAIRGSLIRDDRAAASALTRAVLEAGHRVHENPADATQVFSGYGGKGSIEDLTAMLNSQTHGDRPVGGDLKQQLVLYGDELKLVKVLILSDRPAAIRTTLAVDVPYPRHRDAPRLVRLRREILDHLGHAC